MPELGISKKLPFPPFIKDYSMEIAWIWDLIRVYYQCGLAAGLLFVILSQGAIDVKDVVGLVLFWPIPLLIVALGLRGKDDE